MKRGITGIYHWASEKHMQKYCNEFTFRYDNRDFDDFGKFTNWFGGFEGKKVACIYNSTGYIQQTARLNEWKYFLDRVDINYDTVPVNYFSIFKEMAGLTVSLIKNKVIIDDRTIPEI